MIRPIDIRLNAAHPELPLAEAVTFTGSPSTVLIRGVPPNCGRWAITAVFVAATFPDGSTTTRAAVQSANGVWVATLPATARSGRTENGLRVMADGIDENGEAVTGYILGVADFAVASLGVTPAPEPGETSWQMLYFDAAPGTLRKGDVTKVDGVLKLYNGTAWEPFAAPVTLDDAVTPTSANGVASSGIWSAIWGMATTGFASLYDWCVSQLAGKASKADVDPLLFAQYYPDGSVKSAAEFTAGIKYTLTSNAAERTATVKPFCNTGIAADDNSNLSGRVVIPPFVDAQGNPYITDDGTRYKVVGVSGGRLYTINTSLTAIIAPSTVTTIGDGAFRNCDNLTSVLLPAATNIGDGVFSGGIKMTSVSLPAATTIGEAAFYNCTDLTSISLPAATDIGYEAFTACTSLSTVDFGDTPRSSVPTLGANAFNGVLTTCKIIVPYAQYDEWIAAENWRDLPQDFVRHPEKADKPATFTTGNLAKFDANGNPTDSGKKPSDFQSALSAQQLANIAAVPNKLDKSGGTVTGGLTVQFPVTVGFGGNERMYGVNSISKGSNHIDFPSATGTLALTADIPYDLVTKTIDNGAVTLDDRAINAVAVSASLASLTVNFPTATSGKVRDFGLRLTVASGITTAPQIVLPQGVTCENADGEVPEIGADGAATILYFTETASGVFLVKGEVLQTITQA